MAVVVARFVVQDWLYDVGSTAGQPSRIAMGYPILGLALLVTFGEVRRARGWLVVVTDERSERFADGSQLFSSALCAGDNRTPKEA